MTILSVLSALGVMAQDFRSIGEFKSDVTGKVTANAWLELSLSQNYQSLRLLILPGRDAETADAMVDTLWTRGAACRAGDPVVTDKYEELDQFFLYDLDSRGALMSYYVFSRFVDTTQDDLQQIVIRKFDAEARRIWCMTINSNNDRAKQFFRVIKEARKKMKFKNTTSVKGAPVQEKQYVEPKVYTPSNTIGRGSAYGSGW